MRLFFKESQKTFLRWSFFVVLALTVFLNSAMLMTKEADYGLPSSVCNKACEYIFSLPEDKRIDFIMEYSNQVKTEAPVKTHSFTDNSVYEQLLATKLETEALQIKNYPAYIEEIEAQAEQSEISIFQDSSDFSRKNFAKAARAFAPFKEVTLTFNNSQAFYDMTSFHITDVFIILNLFFIIAWMTIYEKEKGLYKLLRSTKKGRFQLILTKLGLIILSSFFLTIIFWGSDYIAACLKNGSINLEAPIQSIRGFDGSALLLNVKQYLILFYLCKFMVYMVTGFFILLTALKSKYTIGIYVYSFILFATEFALYFFIDGNSGLQLLHYINIIPLADVNSIFRFYFNLNIFQIPVNIIPLSFLFLIILTILIFTVTIVIFSSDKWDSTVRYLRKTNKKKARTPVVNLFVHENYRLLIGQKGLLLILLLILTEGWIFSQKPVYLGTNEYYYRNYMQGIQGDITDQTDGFIISEQNRIEKYEKMLTEAQIKYQNNQISMEEFSAVNLLVSNNLESRDGFQRVVAQYNYTKENNLPLVYDTGYLNLFGLGYDSYSTDFVQAIIMILFMVFIFAEYFSKEYSTGMIKLITTLPFGRRKLLRVKLVLCFFITLLVYLISYLPELWHVGKVYGLSQIFAPVRSIPAMASNKLASLSIVSFLLMIYGYRFIMAVLTALLIFVLAVMRKNTIQAATLTLGILTLPLFIHVLGIDIADYFTLNGLFSMNLVLNEWPAFAVILVMLLPFVFIGFNLGYLFKRAGSEKGNPRF